MTMTRKEIIAAVLGVCVGGALVYLYTHPTPTKDPYDTQVHVHSDFVVYVDGAYVDLSADKYQTTAAQELHQDIHLHDNDGKIIHRHEHDITLAMFFNSLSIPLTNECITTDQEYCTNETTSLLVFVNGTEISSPATYVNQEEDQILIYYGAPEDPIIPSLLETIEDRSCIFSGTCPERGIAPPESCGLTCEI